jgi:hypothetical protein
MNFSLGPFSTCTLSLLYQMICTDKPIIGNIVPNIRHRTNSQNSINSPGSTNHEKKIKTDESLGRAAKLVPAVEDMYVFKGNWPSGFAAVEPGAAVAESTGASGSGPNGKK